MAESQDPAGYQSVIADPDVTRQVQDILQVNQTPPQQSHPMADYGSSLFQPAVNYGLQGAPGDTGPMGPSPTPIAPAPLADWQYNLAHSGITGALRAQMFPEEIGGYKPEQVSGPNGTYRYVNAQGERFYEKPVSEEQRNATNLSEAFFGGQVGAPEIAAGEHAIGQVAGLLGNKALGGAESALRPGVPAFASSGDREAAVQAKETARRLAAQWQVIEDGTTWNGRATVPKYVLKNAATGEVDSNFFGTNPEGLQKIAGQRNGTPPPPITIAPEAPVTPESVFGNKADVMAKADFSYPNPAPFKHGAATQIASPQIIEGSAGGGDYGVLAGQMRTAGATEQEIRSTLGKNYTPPHPDSPVPTIPKNDPLIAEATASGPDGAQAIAQSRKIAEETTGGVPPEPPKPPVGSNEGEPIPPSKNTVSKNFTPATAWGLARDVLYNGIIFPTTNLVHSMGSTISALTRFPEQVILSGVSKVTGKGGYNLGDAFAGLNAQIHGTGASLLHDLPRIIIDGPSSVMNDFDAPEEVSSAILRGEYGSSLAIKSAGVAGKLLALGNYPSRVISAVDWSIRQGLKRSYLIEAGYRDGRALGLEGAELDAHASTYLNSAGTKALQAADDAAKLQINRQAPGTIAKGFLKAKDLSGPIGTVLLPFFNTRLNMLKAATTWTPLGFARLLPDTFPGLGYFARNTVGEAARVQAVMRAGIGTLGAYAIWQQVLADNVTGDGPTDPKQKMIWAGDPANPAHVARAIRTPMGWVTYGKIPVFGDYLAAIADTAEGVKNHPEAQSYPGQGAVMGLLDYFVHEEQGLTNAAATLSALTSWATNQNDKQAQAALAQQLADRGFELVPASGLLRAASNATDPYYRGAPPGSDFGTRLGDQFRANMPGATDLPATGVKRPGGIAQSLPIQIASAGQSYQGTAAGTPPALLAESNRLASINSKFTPLSLPNDRLGQGTDHELRILGDKYPDFARYVGIAREQVVSKVIVSPAYLHGSQDVQERLFKAAVAQADKQGAEAWLKNGVLTDSDPATVQAEAVAGFTTYTSNDQRAAWLAIIQQAGKLTPAVRQAITAVIPQPLPSEGPKPTVDEYLRAAPLVQQYKNHVPYGTDAHPFGNPAEWAALPAARAQEAQIKAQIEKSAVASQAVPYLVQAEMTKHPSPVPGLTLGQLLGKYSSLVENPARRTLLTQNPWLYRYLPTNAASSQ